MATLTPFSEQQLIPQEEKLLLRKKRGQLFIGIPKENFSLEKRVCLTPDAVNMLTKAGHKVLIETGAGEGASYSDKEYSEAGAFISESKEKVYNCPLILKILPPTLEEVALMKNKTYLLSSLQLKSQSKEFFLALSKKKITAISFEHIQDKEQSFPFLHAISEIHIASELMSIHNNGKGLLFGNITGVQTTEVVILGAGVVAEFAANTALAMGANIKIFDNSIHRLKRIQKALPHKVSTSTITDKPLTKALMRCDVVIGAIKGCNRSPVVVTEEMVQKMKRGSIIIDVSIDNGGCFETSELTSHEKPIFEKYGVIHYGVPNITSRYSKTATLAISNLVSPFLLELSENGGIEEVVQYDRSLRSGIYIYKGMLVNESVGKWFDIDAKDLNLLFLS
mgnify:CR=1 FL=1